MELKLNLPIDLFVNVNKSLKSELERIILVEMWKRGCLSNGKFAELYGITKWEFLEMNKNYGDSYFILYNNFYRFLSW
jgi:hypothetical protein